jgi:hypothetical protein
MKSECYICKHEGELRGTKHIALLLSFTGDDAKRLGHDDEVTICMNCATIIHAAWEAVLTPGALEQVDDVKTRRQK